MKEKNKKKKKNVLDVFVIHLYSYVIYYHREHVSWQLAFISYLLGQSRW